MTRDPSGEMRTGWVYRSDAAPALVQPAAADASHAAPGRVVPVRVEQRSAAPPPPPKRERGWIESGFRVMTLPMTITMDLMFAPVTWMFRGRSRQ